jgi:hypothetical protein
MKIYFMKVEEGKDTNRWVSSNMFVLSDDKRKAFGRDRIDNMKRAILVLKKVGIKAKIDTYIPTKPAALYSHTLIVASMDLNAADEANFLFRFHSGVEI